jgi:uncharacterized protein
LVPGPDSGRIVGMDVHRWADARGIEVSGRGVVSAEPDVVRVRMAVSAVRPTVAGAVADADAAVRRVRAALAARDVTGRDAATEGLTVAAEQVWDQATGVARVVGYRSRHDLAVTVRAVPALGLVLGEALSAAGDEAVLDAVSFELEDQTLLRAQARALAWQDAAARAGQLADLAGRPLGALLDLVETPTWSATPMPAAGLMMAKRADAELAVEPGSVLVEITLTARWALA